MNYHNITHDDMLNGDGLRVVLWLSGCNHHCKGCQNPITWNPNNGKKFTVDEYIELLTELKKDYISGITFSGGDPLHENNREIVNHIICFIKKFLPNKTIWIYTGYTFKEVMDELPLWNIVKKIDVLVEGKFIEELKDNNYKWAGSTNQRVIDVQETIKKGKVILHLS